MFHFYTWVLSFCLLLNPFTVVSNIAQTGTSNSDIRQVDQLTQQAERLLSSHPDSAFTLAHTALQLATEADYAKGIANGLQLKGRLLYHQGMYKQALKNLLQAEQRYQDLQEKRWLGENLNYQGLVYYAIRQPEQALQRHQQALQLYQEQQDKQGIAHSFGAIGRLHEKQQQYELALSYQQQALTLYQELQHKQGTATILENIGSIHEDKADYPKALEYFNKALALCSEENDSLLLIVVLNNLGDIYRKTGSYEQGLRHTQQALALATRLHNRYEISSAHRDLSKTYELMGDYKAALEHLETGRRLHSELYLQESASQFALLQSLFDMEQKNNEILALEQQQRFNTLTKVVLAGGLVLISLLGFVVISRQRLKIRRNQEVLQQQEEMYKTQHRLMEAELENKALREQQLQHELNMQEKSLTAHTLHIIGKNQTLDELKNKLSEALQEDQKAQRRKFKGLINQIDYSMVQDREWVDFRNSFEKVHQQFYEKLQQQAPDLTPAEVRLASLIKLNLPSKDAATILGISQDSLRVARYRLKKKLSIGQEGSLSGFILNI